MVQHNVLQDSNEEMLLCRSVNTHNLKGIDVNIPLGKWTTVTGVSGSGKSSLVFDTIYAEAQRRFLETLGTYERQFMQGLPQGDFASIENIPAAVALKQTNRTSDPRSVIGTTADVLDPLRALFVGLMKPSCASCGNEITVDNVHGFLSFLKEVRGNKKVAGALVSVELESSQNVLSKDYLNLLMAEGYLRLFADNKTADIEHAIENFSAELWKNKKDVEIVLDRIFLDTEGDLDTANDLESDKELTNRVESIWSQVRYSNRFQKVKIRLFEADGKMTNAAAKVFNVSSYCKTCSSATQLIQIGDLDWQHALGACGRCHGLGNVAEIDEKKIVPNPALSILEGAIKPWSTETFGWYRDKLVKDLKACGTKINVPFADLPSEVKEFIWKGVDSKGTFKKIATDFVSIKNWFDFLEAERYKPSSRILLAKYRKFVVCEECLGLRLKNAGRNAVCRGRSFHSLVHNEVNEVLQWVEQLKKEKDIREKLVQLNEVYDEVVRKLRVLKDLGLATAALSRRCRTLSGGEYQRVLLTRVIGNGLTDALYVLDEPSVGLGKDEIPKLIEAVKQLRDLGNTVLMVEHEPALIKHADFVIELGPGGGSKGGNLLPLNGELPASCAANLQSPNISKSRKAFDPGKRAWKKDGGIFLEGFSFLNCSRLNVEIPLGKLTVVTGPSGAGKSTLVRAGLQAALDLAEEASQLQNSEENLSEGIGVWKRLHLPDDFFASHQSVSVDQKAMHRVISSVPATVLGIMDSLRKVFANTESAKHAGLGPSDFSFNGGGACATCGGKGIVKDDLFFLGQVDKQCPDCGGKRYRKPILDVMFFGRSIADWLEAPMEEFYERWKQIPGFAKPLQLALRLGLGHLPLGVPTTLLSGGEAQRLRICAAIVKSSQPMICVLDEPSRGLSEKDVGDLIQSLLDLALAGHTFVVVEHHSGFVNCAHQVLLMGPGGGRDGGKIVGRELVV